MSFSLARHHFWSNHNRYYYYHAMLLPYHISCLSRTMNFRMNHLKNHLHILHIVKNWRRNRNITMKWSDCSLPCPAPLFTSLPYHHHHHHHRKSVGVSPREKQYGNEYMNAWKLLISNFSSGSCFPTFILISYWKLYQKTKPKRWILPDGIFFEVIKYSAFCK